MSWCHIPREGPGFGRHMMFFFLQKSNVTAWWIKAAIEPAPSYSTLPQTPLTTMQVGKNIEENDKQFNFKAQDY